MNQNNQSIRDYSQPNAPPIKTNDAFINFTQKFENAQQSVETSMANLSFTDSAILTVRKKSDENTPESTPNVVIEENGSTPNNWQMLNDDSVNQPPANNIPNNGYIPRGGQNGHMYRPNNNFPHQNSSQNIPVNSNYPPSYPGGMPPRGQNNRHNMGYNQNNHHMSPGNSVKTGYRNPSAPPPVQQSSYLPHGYNNSYQGKRSPDNYNNNYHENRRHNNQRYENNRDGYRTNNNNVEKTNITASGIPLSNTVNASGSISYLPGTASLVEEVDKKQLVILRDGKMLIGILRSVDQFANLVLQNTYERILIDGEFCDMDRGIYLIRGENVALMGDFDEDKENMIQNNQCSDFLTRKDEKYILEKFEVNEKAESDKAIKKSRQLRDRGMTLYKEYCGDQYV